MNGKSYWSMGAARNAWILTRIGCRFHAARRDRDRIRHPFCIHWSIVRRYWILLRYATFLYTSRSHLPASWTQRSMHRIRHASSELMPINQLVTPRDSHSLLLRVPVVSRDLCLFLRAHSLELLWHDTSWNARHLSLIFRFPTRSMLIHSSCGYSYWSMSRCYWTSVK